MVERVLAPHALPDDIRVQSGMSKGDASRLVSLLDDPNAVHPDDLAKGGARAGTAGAHGVGPGAGNEDDDDEDDDDDDAIVADHIDISAVTEQLPNLESLSICYRVSAPVCVRMRVCVCDRDHTHCLFGCCGR